MILVDTSVWIAHFKIGIEPFQQALDGRNIFMHSLVLGELAAGNFPNRDAVLNRLKAMPQATRVSDYLVLQMID